MNQMEDETNSTIMAALSTLTQAELADISAHFLRQRQRLTTILSSQILFSLTLHRLKLLSLSSKTTLLAKHLLSSLSHLIPQNHHKYELRPRDLDAVLLLLLLCDTSQSLLQSTPPLFWRKILLEVYVNHMLTPCTSGIGSSALLAYIEATSRSLRFVMGSSEFTKVVVAASVATVVGLPSVEIGGGRECVICTEEMREGREVCRMPCGHMFHWKCAIRWLRNNNTCPYCRFQLPTDDVFGEIQRLWNLLLRMGGAGKHFTPIHQPQS